MRSYSQKRKNKIIIGTLCGVMLLMVVGYAAFNSVLEIKGISSISSNWNIKITSITSNVLNGSASNASEPTGVGTLTATFETDLVSPGDSMEYTITVTNSGTLNANLEKITMSNPDNEYVTFTASINGETINTGENTTFTDTTKTLNAGESKDIKVVVTFKDVTINKMEPISSNLTLTLDYAQNDGSGGGTSTTNTLNLKGVDVEIAETGDGLYADEYESGRYFYRGINPNNYINFNGELWRILSVESDGTLKIMKKDGIGSMLWDKTGGKNGDNSWERPADLNIYLNDDTEGIDSYYNSLSTNAKGLIQLHNFGVGKVRIGNTDLAAQIQSENGTIWNGKIGLMTASEYLRANTNTEQCGNYNLNNANYNTCRTTNYIVPSSGYLWTISPDITAPPTYRVFYVDNLGRIKYYGTTNESPGVLPVLYLVPNIQLDGEGTSDNPYTIVTE